MNKKIVWLTIPIALLPYLMLFVLATISYSTTCPFFECIMESIFCGNVLNLIAALLLYCVLAGAFSVICFAASIRKGWDPLRLAKNAMIIKLIQLPAYALIFIWGILLAITIFTIPFSVGLFLLDCLTLFLTGLLTTAAVINAVRQGVFASKEVVWIIILQLFFCADVVASIVFYFRLRERSGSQIANSQLHIAPLN